jgi:hypothetical protein
MTVDFTGWQEETEYVRDLLLNLEKVSPVDTIGHDEILAILYYWAHERKRLPLMGDE